MADVELNRAKDPPLFGENVLLGENVVHVLVRLPGEQSVPSRTRLRSQTFLRQSREGGEGPRLIPQGKFQSGETNIWPNMGHSTNVFGCGKSTFGQEYIWRCQSLKPDPRVPDFMDTLRNYHTMPIKFETDHVLDENGDFDCYLTSQSLVECLRDSSKRSWSNLLPFGRDSIKTITKRTRWEETKSESIQDELQLTEEQVTLAADHLLDTTFGHPRSLQLALEKCQSYDDLLTYTTK